MKGAWPFGGFLVLPFREYLISAVILCATCPVARAATHPAHVNSLVTQQFFCYAGLDHQECSQNIARLRTELVRYSADLPRDWSWVIVGSEDWQPLVHNLHLDGRSPAFTAMAERETFLEGALFLPKSARTDELVRNLGVTANQLLTLAVSHELAHALCRGGDEAIANRVSYELRTGEKIDCTNSLSPLDELYLRNRPTAYRHGDPRASGCVVPISSIDCQ